MYLIYLFVTFVIGDLLDTYVVVAYLVVVTVKIFQRFM